MKRLIRLTLFGTTLFGAERLSPVESKIIQSVNASTGESNALLEKLVNSPSP
jgi:hypothetical protein